MQGKPSNKICIEFVIGNDSLTDCKFKKIYFLLPAYKRINIDVMNTVYLWNWGHVSLSVSFSPEMFLSLLVSLLSLVPDLSCFPPALSLFSVSS